MDLWYGTLFAISIPGHRARGNNGSDAHDPGKARAQMIGIIEAAQTPHRQEYDPCTLRQVMDRMHMPGLSVAEGDPGWQVRAGSGCEHHTPVVEIAGGPVSRKPVTPRALISPRNGRFGARFEL